MFAGKLRHRIELQRSTESRGPSGQVIEGDWTTYATVWASVNPLQGREALVAKQIVASLTHTIRLRFLEGIRTTDRILFDGRTFQISSVVNPEERNLELVLMCTEVL